MAEKSKTCRYFKVSYIKLVLNNFFFIQTKKFKCEPFEGGGSMLRLFLLFSVVAIDQTGPSQSAVVNLVVCE